MIYALAAVAVAFGNLFLFQYAWHRFGDNAGAIQQLHNDLTVSQTWMIDRDLWAQRSSWLADKQPKADPAGQSNVALLESLQKSASDNHLTIEEQTLKEARNEPNFQEASVQLRLSGNLESLCRWMLQVQQPEAFQAVPSFSLKANDNDPSIVRCSLTVARWYAPR